MASRGVQSREQMKEKKDTEGVRRRIPERKPKDQKICRRFELRWGDKGNASMNHWKEPGGGRKQLWIATEIGQEGGARKERKRFGPLEQRKHHVRGTE